MDEKQTKEVYGMIITMQERGSDERRDTSIQNKLGGTTK
jgi:hypothetical protein